MKTKKLLVNELSDDIYADKNISKVKIFVVVAGAFFVAFFFHFSFNDKIEIFIASKIKSFRSCPIKYKKMDISLLVPRITLLEPMISGLCFKNPDGFVQLEELEIKMKMPSIYPPGLNLHLSARRGETVVNVYPKILFGKYIVRIDKTVVDSSFLSKVVKGFNILKGTFTIESLIEIKDQQIVTADIELKSKNLSIPAQTISGFDIQTMNIGNFRFTGDIKNKSNLNVQALIIGNESSPIIASFDGNVNLNQRNIQYSTYDLMGELKLSDKFLGDYFIIEALLKGKKRNKNGAYKLELKGMLKNPQMPNFL